MVGTDPDFVVTVQSGEAEPTLLMPEPEVGSAEAGEPPTGEAEEEPVARITLRLPQSVKAKVDEMASSEGISTNAWLIRAVMDALSERSGAGPDWPQPPRPPMPPLPPMNPMVIPTPPFGPRPTPPSGPRDVFGPEGPFGPGGVFGERLRRARREEKRSRGNA